NLLGRLASTLAAIRPTAIPAAITLIFTAGGIESSEVFPNRMRCFLTLRPGNRLVAGEPLLLVHVCLDQARLNHAPFATNNPGREACRDQTRQRPAQGVARTEALMPRTAEHRMIGTPFLDTELAKPPVGQIDLHLSANPSL